MVMSDSEQLQTLLALSQNSDFYEEPAWEYCEDHNISMVSHSRPYVITRAFNAGWRPDAFV